MDFSVVILKKNVDSYFSGSMSKEELGSWANKAYFELITGSYVETKKIVIYPFLKIVAKFHVGSNDIEDTFPSAEWEIKNIQTILHGKKNLYFHIKTAIPPQVYTMFKHNAHFNQSKLSLYARIRENWSLFFEGMSDDTHEIDEDLLSILKPSDKEDTLLKILEHHISNMFMSNFYIKDNVVNRKKEMSLYSLQSNSVTIGKKIINYLDCYLGTRNFDLIISYNKGIPNILLSV